MLRAERSVKVKAGKKLAKGGERAMSIKNWLAIALFSFILSSCSFDHSSTVESENEQVEGELVVSFFLMSGKETVPFFKQRSLRC